jgi:RNA polymerase sigma-70 factor (ECF subfamily)
MFMENEQPGEDVRSALGSIIEGNSRKWLRFILGILKNEADAEDALQEAVRRVLVREISFPSPEQMKRYLARAIGNAALELYHSRKRERRRQVPLNEHFLHARSPNPHTAMEEQETSRIREQMRQMLHEALMRLPRKQHEAVRLTILESRGHSLRDLVTNSGIPYSTLRHRSNQGLRMMRRYLVRKVNERMQNSEFRIQNQKHES